jgi:hypothetical protein
MGYEVLDADGAASGVSSDPYPPSDVVALDDLPPPPGDLGRPRAPRAPRRPRVPDRLRHVPRLAWVLVAAAGIVGVVLGSWWTARHGDQVREAAARASVQAFATPVSVNPLVTGRGTVADYSIRLINLGNQPLTVTVSADADRPRPDRPAISMLTGTSTVAAGQEVMVRARVPLDCSSAEPVTLRLPVTSADGTAHSLALRNGVEAGVDVTPSDLCTFTDGQQVLEVDLIGTLDRPRLRLRNNSDRALLVALDSGSPLTQSSSELLTVATVPKLPVTVRPHDDTTVGLDIRVATCRKDLGTLSTLSGYGYLGFQGETVARSDGADGGGADDSLDGGAEANAGVDASPLVGAALARACQ